MWWGQDHSALFASDTAHGLVDVLHTFYEQEPGEHERARRERPDGPLPSRTWSVARTRRWRAPTTCCWWAVHKVVYEYEPAMATGSAHALVRA